MGRCGRGPNSLIIHFLKGGLNPCLRLCIDEVNVSALFFKVSKITRA